MKRIFVHTRLSNALRPLPHGVFLALWAKKHELRIFRLTAKNRVSEDKTLAFCACAFCVILCRLSLKPDV
jgi:hypothetical protein